jgi:hypothetical protein
VVMFSFVDYVFCRFVQNMVVDETELRVSIGLF